MRFVDGGAQALVVDQVGRRTRFAMLGQILVRGVEIVLQPDDLVDHGGVVVMEIAAVASEAQHDVERLALGIRRRFHVEVELAFQVGIASMKARSEVGSSQMARL